MVAEPALIKRPVMVAGGKVTSGFDADVQSLIEAGN
jgi:arsenate reductase-like glutaredoxin family protein